MSAFEELSKVDCSSYAEKKGKFTYLSWPFAFSELFKRHPKAEIDVQEWDGFPAVRGPKGWMVKVSITIDGIKRTQWHPVLDHNNRIIAEPDVFALNTSIQRATVKAIALHGLGLYIYAGEDLPEGAQDDDSATATMPKAPITPTSGAWEAMPPEEQEYLLSFASKIKDYIANDDIVGAVIALEAEGLDSDEKVALWTRFDSKQRSAMKREIEARKAAQRDVE